MASRTEGLGRWYTALYYISFLTFAASMGLGISAFTPKGTVPEYGVYSVVYLVIAGISVCSMILWNISASDDGKKLASRFTSVHLFLLLILFSYRLDIAPAVFSRFGGGTEEVAVIAVFAMMVLTLGSFVLCWYRIVLPKIRYTVYYDGGNADADSTIVFVRRAFTFNPLFRLKVSSPGAEHILDRGQTAVITQEIRCFRIRLTYGLAKRDVIISNAERVTIDVGYDCVTGVLMPSVEGMGTHTDAGEGEDDASRYL